MMGHTINLASGSCGPVVWVEAWMDASRDGFVCEGWCLLRWSERYGFVVDEMPPWEIDGRYDFDGATDEEIAYEADMALESLRQEINGWLTENHDEVCRQLGQPVEPRPSYRPLFDPRQCPDYLATMVPA